MIKQTVDEILKPLRDDIEVSRSGEYDRLEAKAKVALSTAFDEVIGADEHTKDCPSNKSNSLICVCPLWMQNQMSLRAEQRKRKEELLG